MARAITQLKVLAVDEDISKGLEQLNKHIYDMQSKNMIEIIDIKAQGNIYYITYHTTPTTEQQPEVQEQANVQDIGHSEILH